jgi:hypothetical protein
MRKVLLNQTPTITRENVDRLLPTNDTCTRHINEFRGLAAIMAFKLFRAAKNIDALQTLIGSGTQAAKQFGHKH